MATSRLHLLSSPMEIAEWLRARVRGALQCDSRQVRAGDGFVAWPGAATDGRRFVSAALAAGAAAVLVEAEGVEVFGFTDERVLAVPGLKALAGPIASAFCGDPSAQLDVVAITGTNGKTSCAWWTAQLLSAAQKPCAVVGTLGIGRPPLAGASGHGLVPTGLTTPDPVLLQTRLRELREEGVSVCAIEASSIGLAEGRLNALRIRLAVFTNFTQDHLDFHGSMDAYWDAKAALFRWPGLRQAVINLDDPRGPALADELKARGLDVWTVGIDAPGHQLRLQAQDIGVTASGMRLVMVERDSTGAVCASHTLELPLVGRYNVSNLLCVLASARALGVDLASAVAACQTLTPVPGRMEQVAGARAGQPLVLVDYAHTPDALEKALQALQPLAQQRGGALWVVVGCGGDRDASKRPLMAAVAEAQARHPVLTSDNPRSEDPLAILAQMRAGLRDAAAVRIEADRARAIALAVQQAVAADVVLIAGKGHEDYQDVRGVKTAFSDQAHARAALQQRAPAPGVAA
jgi:UDP-N-acetylmuramoyl-L-alanyl-D-glutamate--2,6-diaminopimelate ligase